MGGIATIGVYGWDPKEFIGALTGAAVGVLIDVRERRGVRGAEYSWANAKRLEGALAETGIEYRHRPDLAPSKEMRQTQYQADERRSEGKRSRGRLAPEFAETYADQVLATADLSELVGLADRTLPALLCVERDAEACHRSLIAERLEREHGLAQVHFLPQEDEAEAA